MQIHQILPGFQYGDAISDHARALKQLLRTWGYESEIFAEKYENRLVNECRPLDEFRGDEQTIAIYHYSIGAEAPTQRFQAARGKRLLIYHNITPPDYLAPYNPHAAQVCAEGRAMLGGLSAHTDLALGDSAYNCQELAELGFRSPRVLPIGVDFERFADTTPCPRIMQRYNDGWKHFLFVGRLTPNKHQEDVIRAFEHYHRHINRRSRLFLVGNGRGFELYQKRLEDLIADLQIEDHVILTGHVQFSELVAYYSLADLFLCMSEHEGFCVPLVEALHFGLPVLAYAAAAIPDTLGDAGVLFRRKEFALIAEIADRLIRDAALRNRVLRRQCERLEAYQPAKVAERFRAYVDELVAPG